MDKAIAVRFAFEELERALKGSGREERRLLNNLSFAIEAALFERQRLRVDLSEAESFRRAALGICMLGDSCEAPSNTALDQEILDFIYGNMIAAEEAAQVFSGLPQGALDICRERQAQLEEHGYTAARDDGYHEGELLRAAIALLAAACGCKVKLFKPTAWARGPALATAGTMDPALSPMEATDWEEISPVGPWGDPKPQTAHDRRRALVTGAALIAAEIDRRDRVKL